MENARKVNPDLGKPVKYISTNRDSTNEHEIKRLPIYVHGEGSDITVAGVMYKKAKKKHLTNSIVWQLIKIAHKKGDKELEKAYWNSLYCQTQMTTSDGLSYGKYCRNRVCTICCGIRKAELIRKYLPVISKWSDPHMLTLTARSIPAGLLKQRVSKMLEGLQRIIQQERKRNQRGKGFRLMGIKSLECNFNAKDRTYNPHIHLIVPDRATADLIKKEWLKLFTTKFAEHWCQKIERIRGMERALIEVIKYSTKHFSDPEGKKRGKSTLRPMIYANALHNIYAAVRGRRIFERFGFNLPKEAEPRSKGAKRITDYRLYKYKSKYLNWEHEPTGELITSYTPEPSLVDLLKNNFNMTLE